MKKIYISVSSFKQYQERLSVPIRSLDLMAFLQEIYDLEEKMKHM